MVDLLVRRVLARVLEAWSFERALEEPYKNHTVMKIFLTDEEASAVHDELTGTDLDEGFKP